MLITNLTQDKAPTNGACSLEINVQILISETINKSLGWIISRSALRYLYQLWWPNNFQSDTFLVDINITAYS